MCVFGKFWPPLSLKVPYQAVGVSFASATPRNNSGPVFFGRRSWGTTEFAWPRTSSIGFQLSGLWLCTFGHAVL